MLRIGLQFFAIYKVSVRRRTAATARRSVSALKNPGRSGSYGRQHNCQTERNQDSSRSECRTRPDDTLFALVDGTVKFEPIIAGRKQVSAYVAE